MRALDPAASYPVVPVGRLANYITRRMQDDPKLRWIGVRGEISGLSIQPNGNVYFDLKDRDALLKCIVWSEAAAQLPALANGQGVVAVGGVATYVKKSQFQLIVQHIEQDGVGRLHARYEDLKRRLDAEGLFADGRKRPLPRYPFRVALVSSRTANGAGDFLSEAARLAPHVAIELFETPVQGESAAPEIVRAIERAGRAPVDLIVIARGGGSYEDLFAFSDERVVRAVARCGRPTVSAIGHEADAPLIDFVADRRASTPTAAARLVLPPRAELLQRIAGSTRALGRTMERTLARARADLARVEVRSPLTDPSRLLAARRQRVDAAVADGARAAEQRLRRERDRVATLVRRLEARNPGVQLAARGNRLALAMDRLRRSGPALLERKRLRCERLAAGLRPAVVRMHATRERRLSLQRAHLDGKDPTSILERGYAIVTIDGRIVRDAAAVPVGTAVAARVARGTLRARVESVERDGGE